MGTTETQQSTKTKLNRIAWLSKQDPGKKFECLMHLFNQESLNDCFHRLDANKAVGVDGIDKTSYGENLESNIQGLLKKMRDMAYRPGPVREVQIPKEGKLGVTRPLGISNLEDKLVQGVAKEILESIYEPLFLNCSYGFRPRRGCHDAIRELQQHLYGSEVQTVIDIDLKDFFGSIDHELLKDILIKKIKDTRFMRYISRMFKAGVLAKGELRISEEGVVQGSICSPVLANIFAHYVIDVWIKEMVQPHCEGIVRLFRYCDDAVICCQSARDAHRIKTALQGRLEKFKLKLNEEKTHLVPFDKRQAAKGIEQGIFDFLGFTFYLGKSRKGNIVPMLRTRAKTMKSKLKRVSDWIKGIRNKAPVNYIWKIFKTKLRGHIQYYGVSFNTRWVRAFLNKSCRIVFKWLNRRSQRKSLTWDEFMAYMRVHPLPCVIVVHPLF
jgi:RNA-directed DNA polymerase